MLPGERVTLRAISREDLPRLCAFNNDLAVEVAGGGDPPLPQSLARLQAEFDQEAAKGGRDGTTFAIEADGQLIGQCALFRVDAVARTAEVGIALGDRAYWGRGYGRESLRLLVDYGFTHHNFHKLWLRVNGRNERAQRAYRAVGFGVEGRQVAQVWSAGAYDDLVYMGLVRERWEAGGRGG